ncbi:S-layer homology domain-containing protein [Paenibacillus tuaregi]|uniref:S-layer homology domain-containing protein n=1 Tax=Paenibacillus tuaregi TaxID=1816681 RepID=UPI000839846D|nr:S-layer homology domain-containing protein [Paenibacillus tuaregi]
MAFSDTEKHWARQEITAWAGKGWIEGYPNQTFRPDKGITRAEAAVLINRALNIPNGQVPPSVVYHDMVQNRWDWGPLTAAVASGYMRGYDDGTMRADQPVSRQEIAVMLTRFVQIQSTKEAKAASFVDPLPNWSREAVENAVRAGWMHGYPDGTFKADHPLTRAEALVILSRFKLAEGMDGEVRYTKNGIYGPEKGRRIIDGSVIVDGDGITLRNITINGDLTLSERIGEGESLLRGVVVKGKVAVLGGGENSIHLQDTEISNLTIGKKGGAVRVVAKGRSVVEEAQLRSSAVLEEEQLTGPGFKQVLMTSDMTSNSLLRIRGQLDSLAVQSAGSHMKLERGSIKILDVLGDSKDSVISLEAGSQVEKAGISGPVAFNGQGKISYAEIRNSEVRFERSPDRVSCLAGISHSLCGVRTESPAPPTNSSGGSSPGNETKPATVTALVYEPKQIVLTKAGEQVQVKLVAKWSDGRTSDVTTSAKWSTDDPGVAVVSGTGLVKESGEGQTFIRALYEGAAAQISVTVAYQTSPPTVTELVYEPKSIYLTSIGGQAQLQLSAKWSNGKLEAITSKAKWSSLDPKIAAVNSGGLVEAAGEGTTQIKAAYEGLTATIPVHVSLAGVVENAAMVTASVSTSAPVVGKSNSFTLTVQKSDGTVDTSFNGTKRIALSLSGAVSVSSHGYGSFNMEPLLRPELETDVVFMDGISTSELILFVAGAQTMTFTVEDVKAPKASVAVTPTPEEAVRIFVKHLITDGTARSGKLFLNLVVDLLDPYDNRAATTKSVRVKAEKQGASGPDIEGVNEAASVEGQAVFRELYGRGTGTLNLTIQADGLPDVESSPITIQAPFQGSGTADDPYQVSSAELLNEVRYYPDAAFRQTKDIDLSSYSEGEGWVPIGTGRIDNGQLTYDSFRGTYDGGGFTIRHLTGKNERGWLGLFGHIQGSKLTNIHLKDLQLEGTFYTGGLVGQAWYSTISDSSVEGTISGTSVFGGLAGFINESVIERSSAKVELSATQASSSVKLAIVGYIGGLLGGMDYAAVKDSFAEGSLITDDEDYNSGVGGLVGFIWGPSRNNKGMIDGSYANFDIQMKRGTRVGGLVGMNDSNTLSNTYAKGNIEIEVPSSLMSGVGGLVGTQVNGLTKNSYAAVAISTDLSEVTGGLTGLSMDNSQYVSSYYDSQVSKQSDTGKGIPLSTKEMWNKTNYVNWEFYKSWYVNGDCGYPYLIWQKNVPGTACFQVKLLEEGPKTQGKLFELLITGANDASGTPLNGFHIVEVFLSTNPSKPIISTQVERFENGVRKVTLSVPESGKVNLIVKIQNIQGYRSLDVELGPHPFDGGKGTKEEPFLISTAEQLDLIRDYARSSFKLTKDINLDVAPYNTGSGWRPIDHSQYFRGVFDGDNHTIRGLTISNTDNIPTGLFGRTQGADIRNLHLTQVNIRTGAPDAGGLVGSFYYGQIENVSVQGSIRSTAHNVGGLSGLMYGNAKSVAIDMDLTGLYTVGGVSGLLQAGRSIESASVKGSVYAISVVAGGIAGNTVPGSVILNSYSTAKVTALKQVGGIVGAAYGTIQNCYAAGVIEGGSLTGGISGNLNGVVTDCYYDIKATSSSTGGGEPRTTEEMQKQSTYVNWDFAQVWKIDEGRGYPTLQGPPS